ncbi:L-cystine transport system permease protein YecS [Streptomyces sp. RB5]|uniref:L-cystine transport system permease protein YecS n=1 Tax=Streptomyces smaragdinus TaxID=2585196 RepID=A0A7K0CKJ1_9ACTN|nr:ectoine/hydroxyectoine ABC transporter permease subunit EhuC [Streptomyces smaragdinus]MQY13931.1 L-cystine transport system permease protein YecS [Streptomyces smaragdinus]
MGDFLTAFLDNMPDVRSGLWTTLQATLYGAALAFVLSFLLGLMSGSRLLPVRGVSRVFVEFFRGTSLYVQLFWLYYVLPTINTDYEIEPLLCGVLAFGMNYGAYGSEVVRGALGAVPKAQREAAIALNMTPFQRLRRVVLPQAWPQMIPPFANLLIQLLKCTPLLWLISVQDLMTVMEQLRDRTGETVPAYLTLLVIFFVLAYALTMLMNMLEAAAKARLGQHTSARGLLRSRSGQIAGVDR